jgi:diguanylate cyclase (GGDEF)-like protein
MFQTETIDLVVICGNAASEEGALYCQSIRKLPTAKTVPIILAGAHLTPEVIENSYYMGASDIVSMLHPELLHQHIQLLLKNQQFEELTSTHPQAQNLGVIVTDQHQNLLYLSKIAQQLTGWLAHEARQQNLSQVFQLLDTQSTLPISLAFPTINHDNLEFAQTSHRAALVHRSTQTQTVIECVLVPFPLSGNNSLGIGTIVVFWETLEQQKLPNKAYQSVINNVLPNKFNGNILVAEDSAWMRMTLKWALEEWDYNVMLAEDGELAVESFKENPVDLILMDADMPVLNGIEACKQIRALANGRNVPIVMVTGLDSPKWVDSAYRAGVTDFVSKPIVNWAVLRNRIHYLMTAKRNEDALFDEKERAQITLASIGEGVITTDTQGRVEYLNQVAISLTGWSVAEAKGKLLGQVFQLVEEEPNQNLMALPIDAVISRPNEEYLTFFAQRFICKVVNNPILMNRVTKQKFAIEETIAPIQDRNGNVVGQVLVFRDITENRNLILELWHKATHDALTNLFNRSAFELQAHSLLSRLEHPKLAVHHHHFLMYMDLDRFKTVNDTCGYEAGDQLLQNVAYLLQQRISEYKRFNVTFARLGGDEFGLLMENATREQANELANRLREDVCNYRFLWTNRERKEELPQDIDRRENFVFSIGASIGVVLIPEDSLSYESLAAMAGDACHHAKNAGGNGIYIYQVDNPNPNIEWVKLIKHNLQQEGFVLFTQEIRALGPRATHGMCWEFLLRMYGEDRTLLKPGAFFSNASRNNLMPAIDRWVVKQIFEWFQRSESVVNGLSFATVNISYYSLEDPELLNFIAQHAPQMQLPTHKICFEIGETSLINNFTGTANFIRTLKALGFRFAIDNFGTGMSAFHYLHNLPIDFIKIDGALIGNITNPSTFMMVKAIYEIARLEDIRIIAEWVEDAACLQKLDEIGIDYVQGYFIAPEIPLVLTEN